MLTRRTPHVRFGTPHVRIGTPHIRDWTPHIHSAYFILGWVAHILNGGIEDIGFGVIHGLSSDDVDSSSSHM